MLAPNPRQPSLFKRIASALAPMPRAKPFSEMGVSGTLLRSGYAPAREKSSKWTGTQKYISIADMAVNTSIIAAGVHYFLNLVAHPTWTVKAADEDDAEAVAAAELVESVLYGLTRPWSRVVRRAATYRFYGFGVQEWTAARRPDGAIGLASIEPRPQHTIERWAVSDAGDLEGVYQRSPQTGAELALPRAKFMYLVDDTLTDSPEGVGIFRHLAEPWERLKTYYDLEARAFERDLRGIPVGRIPYNLLNAAVKNGDITEAKAEALVKAVEDFVQIAIKESNTGITLDSAPYESQASDGAKVAGVPQWGLELLSGGASGMGEVAAAITRTQTEMARILTVEHLMMGESAGNRALAEDKSRNLYLVANAVLTDIAAAVDSDVVARVCDLNGIAEDKRPYCEVEDVAFKDAQMVSGVLAQMAQAGAVLAPDDPVIEDVRSLMGVQPPPPPSPEMLGLPTEPPTDEELAGDDAGAEEELSVTDEGEDEVGKHADHDQSTHGNGGGGGSGAGEGRAGPSTAAGLATAIDAPAHATVHESSISFAVARTHADANKKLVAAGFKRETSRGRTERSKLGRSAAYSSAKVQEATYSHPAGHFASIKTSTSRYGDKTPRTYYNVQVASVKKADDQPRTLYVKRRLLNSAAVRAWAKEQGFGSALPDMHVTVAYSKKPVDWSSVEPDEDALVVPGGGRTIERFDGGAVVLRLSSPALQQRWRALRDAGADWKYDNYKPHVTITYEGAGVDLEGVAPYQGLLIFGPEVFAEVVAGGFNPDDVEEDILKVVNRRRSIPRARTSRAV